jgi:GT2 family glycosyltransferase
VRNGVNLGFGAGCNRGAAQARGDMLLFLNPDCRIEPDTPTRVRAHADARIGVVGVSIVAADGRPEPASRRRDPLLRRALMTATGLAGWESRWPALAGTNLPGTTNFPALEDVDAVSGALMLVPRPAFDRVEGFDEGYFLHFEDSDLCRRMRDAGLRVVCANAIRVVHNKGTSSRARPFFVAWHKHHGMWRWFTKFDPAARNPLPRSLMWLGVWLHYALMTPRYAWLWLRARISRND